MIKYTPKYKHKIMQEYKNPGGLRANPDNWITGPDEIEHDKYYAWLKHRCQAKYRGEDYSLTWEQWQTLWPNDKWFERGRSKHSLCLIQIDRAAGWHYNNVEVVERVEYLKRASEYRARSQF